MDSEELEAILLRQDGVISRRQLVEIGAQDHDVRRLLRRRGLTKIHAGVYVDHTGEPTWHQRAWAAVLLHWPAALARESALPGPRGNAPIHVAIDVRRTVASGPGIRVHRMPYFDQRVLWFKAPPQVSVEDAAIDVAADAVDIAGAFGTLADACQAQATNPRRLSIALTSRRRVRNGRLLRSLVDDLSEGACSVLERGYLNLERNHGLPRGQRQAPATLSGRTALRDVEYRALRTVIELDGRAFHYSARLRDRDSERDLDSVVDSDLLTVRLTYGQVFRSGCRTAARIGALLRRRGWQGSARKCADCP